MTTLTPTIARSERLARWGQLLAGLLLYGVAITLMIRSNLGLGPWDLFHLGLSKQLGIRPGMANQVVGLVLLALLLLARVRFGWGTISNILLIGLVNDLTMPLVPEITALWAQLAVYGVGVFACGMATGLYIGAAMGAGPRDSLMLMVSKRTGWPVRRVRTLIELSVLLGGWLMGGTLGLGTVLFALGIGPAAQLGLRWFDRRPAD